MPIQPRFIPLVGLLALLPIAAFIMDRPELGAVLSVISTFIIVGSVVLMVWPERENRGKVFGPGSA